MMNPYDALPYLSLPIEWSAPERLALASLLHGGPRAPLDAYRVLELGCANGANLLPLAYYRPHATFVGVDGAETAIRIANERKARLALTNVEFVSTDFLTAAGKITGDFDFIIAHGIFSWVTESARDALFEICAKRIRPGGLVYLNYNARPGWNIRGMVRDFLLAQTADEPRLAARADLARDTAARLTASLAAAPDDPYTRLLEREFRFVSQSHPSYVAHEFLADENHAYWRSEFESLANRHGLAHVADADFNYGRSRIPESLREDVAASGLLGRSLNDTIDLLSYRQLHSPILTTSTWTTTPPRPSELAQLIVASSLEPLAASRPDAPRVRTFRHSSGFEVEAKVAAVDAAFERLQPLWPRGVRLASLFDDPSRYLDDVTLLQRHGLIDLRLVEPGDFEPPPRVLNDEERGWGGYSTSPYHVREAAAEG